MLNNRPAYPPNPADTSTARPESAKTASSPRTRLSPGGVLDTHKS